MMMIMTRAYNDFFIDSKNVTRIFKSGAGATFPPPQQGLAKRTHCISSKRTYRFAGNKLNFSSCKYEEIEIHIRSFA